MHLYRYLDCGFLAEAALQGLGSFFELAGFALHRRGGVPRGFRLNPLVL